MDEIVTAEMIRNALEAQYEPPEWYLGFEVGNSTGANCRRHADAVAVNAFPSKGFETRGFEIKVSKNDLASELKNGEKSDEIARFCDYWFLVTPKGLSSEFTLPPTWGVIEFSNGKLNQKCRATKLDKQPITMGFLCAVLRGRERLVASKAGKITAAREERIRTDAQWEARSAVNQLKQLRDKLALVRDQTGISLDDWHPTESMIRKLKAAEQLEIIARNVMSMERIAKDLTADIGEIQKAVSEISNVAEPPCNPA